MGVGHDKRVKCANRTGETPNSSSPIRRMARAMHIKKRGPEKMPLFSDGKEREERGNRRACIYCLALLLFWHEKRNAQFAAGIIDVFSGTLRAISRMLMRSPRNLLHHYESVFAPAANFISLHHQSRGPFSSSYVIIRNIIYLVHLKLCVCVLRWRIFRGSGPLFDFSSELMLSDGCSREPTQLFLPTLYVQCMPHTETTNMPSNYPYTEKKRAAARRRTRMRDTKLY